MQAVTPATTLASASRHHLRKKSPWSRSNRSHHEQQKRPWSRSSRSHHHQQKSAPPVVLLNKPSQIATLSRRATGVAISFCADAVGGSSSTRGLQKASTGSAPRRNTPAAIRTALAASAPTDRQQSDSDESRLDTWKPQRRRLPHEKAHTHSQASSYRVTTSGGDSRLFFA